MNIYYRNTTKHDNSIQKDKYNVLCVCKDCGRPVLNLTDISDFGSLSNLKSIIAGKMRENTLRIVLHVVNRSIWQTQRLYSKSRTKTQRQ